MWWRHVGSQNVKDRRNLKDQEILVYAKYVSVCVCNSRSGADLNTMASSMFGMSDKGE